MTLTLLNASGAAWAVSAAAIGAVFALLTWERWWPSAFDRQVTARLQRRRVTRMVRTDWADLMVACGLGVERRDLSGAARMDVPHLEQLRWHDGDLLVWPRLLMGQTVDAMDAAGEGLRVALGAHALRVVPNETRSACHLAWSFADRLAEPFARPVPTEDDAVELDSVLIGKVDGGDAWRLNLRMATLVAGASGAGKGSVLWGTVLALAPSIRAGVVQLRVIDLKGGMETGIGADLFTQLATTPEDAVSLLEEAVEACGTRAEQLAGRVRLHTPTPAEPLVLVLVDELASLVAYVPDREVLRRAEMALSRLLSVGRAVGFFVHAYVQDPRKETVRMRHLFQQTVALRLREREEVAMLLGDGAIRAGAACHRISPLTPGVGYVLAEEGRLTRVRAALVTDDVIRHAAARWRPPTRLPIRPLSRSPGNGASRTPRPSRAARAVAAPVTEASWE